MTGDERLARIMWPHGRYGAELMECCQRAVDAGWTPPPPTLAEAVATFRGAWNGEGADQSDADALFAALDALDQEADA